MFSNLNERASVCIAHVQWSWCVGGFEFFPGLFVDLDACVIVLKEVHVVGKAFKVF